MAGDLADGLAGDLEYLSPLEVLEEEVEITKDVPKGTDMSNLANKNMDSTSVVDAYGAQMPMNQVGTVSVPEPRMLSVQVWDKSLVGAVEKAIRESDLGLNPQTEGQLVRVPIPQLTEERRVELTKIANK